MKIDIELQGRSFVAVTDSEFAAGAVYAMGLDDVTRTDSGWRVVEKRNGGAGLVRALRQLEDDMGFGVGYSNAALNEAVRRLVDDDRRRGRS